jgi:signal peptidase I
MTTESGAPWAPPRPPQPSRGSRAGRITFWAVFGLVAVCLVSCVTGAVLTLRAFTDPSASMQNTIGIGDRMYVQRGQDVRRGDIVVYTVPPGAGGQIAGGTYVKRLIGLPGDHVACCDAAGDVTVNGVELDERAYLYPGDKPATASFSVTLGPGQAWVMGDHRQISLDSREYGPVPTADITGRVIQIGHGFSWSNVTTPETFVADGLAQPDTRQPVPFVLLGAAAFLALALTGLGVFGVVRWSLRRSRSRQAAAAYWQVP